MGKVTALEIKPISVREIWRMQNIPSESGKASQDKAATKPKPAETEYSLVCQSSAQPVCYIHECPWTLNTLGFKWSSVKSRSSSPEMSKAMMAVESHLWPKLSKQGELLWCVLRKAPKGLDSQHKKWKKTFIFLWYLSCTYVNAWVPFISPSYIPTYRSTQTCDSFVTTSIINWSNRGQHLLFGKNAPKCSCHLGAEVRFGASVGVMGWIKIWYWEDGVGSYPVGGHAKRSPVASDSFLDSLTDLPPYGWGGCRGGR